MKLPRPQRLPSTTYELPTNCGKIYITVTTDSDGLPFEIFARFGKAGSCGAAIFDGLTRIVSYALRSGMDPADAVKAFSGISCSRGRNTCLHAASAALKEALAALPSPDSSPPPSPLPDRAPELHPDTPSLHPPDAATAPSKAYAQRPYHTILPCHPAALSTAC